ncbi:MAG: VanZ family protein [Balneolales bacterium]
MITTLEKYPILRQIIPLTVVVWTIITLYLTLSPTEYIAEAGVFQFDKVGHFAMFGGWTGLIGLYLMIYKKNYNLNLLPLIIAGILFGAFVEFLQIVLPIDRSPGYMDMLANTLGCLTAYGILKILQSRAKASVSKSVH